MTDPWVDFKRSMSNMVHVAAALLALKAMLPSEPLLAEWEARLGEDDDLAAEIIAKLIEWEVANDDEFVKVALRAIREGLQRVCYGV